MWQGKWQWLAASIMVAALVGCGKKDGAAPAASINGNTPEAGATDNGSTATPSTPEESAPRKRKENLFPQVVLHTTAGDIRIKLNAEKAPVTVDNFLANYAMRGQYDGTIVYYVDPATMIAAGGFDKEYVAREVRTPILNEATNGLLNKRGTIAMARDPDYAQSATSQFFINLVDNPQHDHKDPEKSEEYGYCVFGEVVQGMEVVDAIAKVAVHDHGDFVKTPVEPVVITSVELLPDTTK